MRGVTQRAEAWLLRAMIIVLICLGMSSERARAHDIPTDVRVLAFFKPAEGSARLLLRVPMASLQEVDFPRRGLGYLEVSSADGALRNAAEIWIRRAIDLYADGRKLAPGTIEKVRVSLPSDRSFQSYESALANLDAARLPDDLDLYWNQQSLDLLLSFPIESDRARFSIDLRFGRFGERVATSLRFLASDGATRAFELHGSPGPIALDPSWRQAFGRFLVEGFWHILGGIDHLLFLVCLVLPFRRLRALVVLVTAFTLAHSISLAAAAFGFVSDALWFPPLIETLIAATIVYMAIENIVGSNVERRWMITFAFGLIHGFGFSFLLREQLQFAGAHLVASLLAFNLGVEIGQLAVLVVLVPVLNLVLGRWVPERIGIIVASAFVAHTGWHWFTERGAALLRFPPPSIDAAFLASLMRGSIAVLVLVALVVLANGAVSQWVRGAARRVAAE